ncbi:hypothetical protein KKD03_02020 [Patescibacteria group bacterium]|nr:hypothetical protein [Patescibacteria group bacterium]
MPKELIQQYESKKIFSLEKKLPFNEREVTLVTGYWDLLHYSHVKFLRACRNLGNSLAVGVRVPNSKPGRPILTPEERLVVITELESVDYAFLDITGYTPEMISKIKPKTVVFSSGEKPSPEKQAEISLLVSAFPELSISSIPRQSNEISTTQIIERILSPYTMVQTEAIDLNQIKTKLLAHAENSLAGRKMAAFLVDEELSLVLSKGINYHPIVSGDVNFINTNTYEHQQQLPRPTHAEIDAILSYIQAGGNNFDKSTLFVTAMPCAGCAEQIVRCGIKKVVYLEEFDNNYGELILKEAGVIVESF